ncbi:Kirola [Sesamum angolense]|uniref:Kirola n=1 Tax=Sesamum angolense TaxID=2727404 RepID=A0AAE1WVK5_9LAMI|nr:Kirola [Sesamum angolense]
MGLHGKLVIQISIKVDGDIFFHLFKHKLHHIKNICPQKIQSVNLIAGDWGTVGSVISWNYTKDGFLSLQRRSLRPWTRKRSITYKVTEGDLMAVYNTFKLAVSVDSNGEDNVVTWTVEYEKKNESVPEPSTFLDFCFSATKEIERHYMLVPN